MERSLWGSLRHPVWGKFPLGISELLLMKIPDYRVDSSRLPWHSPMTTLTTRQRWGSWLRCGTLTVPTILANLIVYPDGKVCISILHPPGTDQFNSGETADERWRPILGVESIILSVISMLNDPNISSPANIDAAVEYRDSRETFIKKVKKLTQQSVEYLWVGWAWPRWMRKDSYVQRWVSVYGGVGHTGFLL